MLILSQDGSIAVRFADDCAIYCTKDGSNTNVNIAKHDAAFAIGVYSTEERAIKAIDWISKWYVECVKITLKADCSITFRDRRIIFKMPADDEVMDNDEKN